MGIALACCITAYLLIAYNIEFDQYFKNRGVEDIVKVVQNLESSTGKSYRELTAPILMGPLAREEVAGINQFTRYCSTRGDVSYEDEAFSETVFFADSDFFDLFPMKLKNGSLGNFRLNGNLFLSQKSARKYFGDDDPIGKSMSIDFGSQREEFVVGGVFQKVPLNTSFIPDILIRMESFLDLYKVEPGNWNSALDISLLFRISDINKRKVIADQLKKYILLRNLFRKDSKLISFDLVPFQEKILNGEVRQSDIHLPIPFIALFVFSSMGIIILLIACFNLTNTTLAITGKRNKEIAIRKVTGSSGRQIILQFLLEIVMIIIIAILAGIAISQILVPKFALMWRLQYGLSDLNNTNMIIMLVILLFLTSLLAGLYPAISGSKQSLVQLFNGGSRQKGTNTFTRILLILQFSLSVIVLVLGIMFIRNAHYQRSLDFGYKYRDLLSISVNGVQEYSRLKNEISTNGRILQISGAANHISPYGMYYRILKIDTSEFKTNVYEIGPSYFETVGMNILEGRNFDSNSKSELENAAIIDQKFVESMGLNNPLGRKISYSGKDYNIIGVVNDHMDGLKHGFEPHFYKLSSPEHYNRMIIRTGDKEEMKDYVESAWKKLFPGRPFSIEYQEDLLFEEADGYNVNLSRIFFFLTVLGCMLSLSGIYSMANLNAQRRAKEIGVRKVLGASLMQVIQIVNKEFTILLGVAMIAGGIAGYFFSDFLLQSLYAIHIKIDPWVIFYSSLLLFVIGLTTTIITIRNTAEKNPAIVLRNE